MGEIILQSGSIGGRSSTWPVQSSLHTREVTYGVCRIICSRNREDVKYFLKGFPHSYGASN